MKVDKKQQGKEKHDASINHFAERQYQLLISSQTSFVAFSFLSLTFSLERNDVYQDR